MSYAGKIEDLITERDALLQRVKEFEETCVNHAQIQNALLAELATLKQAQEPVLYQCTKCGGANYGCTCESLKGCTDPLYSAPVQAQEQVAWVRYLSDECYEGPIMDSQMDEVRKQSGNWTPIFAAPKPGKPA